MRNTIWKYQVVPGQNFLALPYGSSFVSVVNQNGTLALYVVVDQDETKQAAFEIWGYGTGWDFPDNPDLLSFIGTVQQGAYVWHFFVKWEDPADKPLTSMPTVA